MLFHQLDIVSLGWSGTSIASLVLDNFHQVTCSVIATVLKLMQLKQLRTKTFELLTNNFMKLIFCHTYERTEIAFIRKLA